MVFPRVSYYVPHERVFVNSRKRSNSVNPVKTPNFFEINKNILEQSVARNTVQNIKYDSNFLLGSSIVNLNFVNNVPNPNRGYEGYRNITVLSGPAYQRNDVESLKFESHYTNAPSHNPNAIETQNVFPFENYNYRRYWSETQTPTNKTNLNIEDRIVPRISCRPSSCPSIAQNDYQEAILTRNYLSHSDETLAIADKEDLSDSNSTKTVCELKDGGELGACSRKARLNEYLERIKNFNEKAEKAEKKVKITIGKPTHEYVAKYPDPVEKELEKWHNSHNSTLKWERVRHGLYSVGGSIVHLVKSNGGLYVQGHGFKKHKGQMAIFRFVEEKESQVLKEKGKAA